MQRRDPGDTTYQQVELWALFLTMVGFSLDSLAHERGGDTKMRFFDFDANF